MIVYRQKSIMRKPMEASEGDLLIVTDSNQIYYREGNMWILALSATGGGISIRGELTGGVWKTVSYGSTFSVRPNYQITLRNNVNINKFEDAAVRNWTESSIDIFSAVDCSLELIISPVTREV